MRIHGTCVVLCPITPLDSLTHKSLTLLDALGRTLPYLQRASSQLSNNTNNNARVQPCIFGRAAVGLQTYYLQTKHRPADDRYITGTGRSYDEVLTANAARANSFAPAWRPPGACLCFSLAPASRLPPRLPLLLPRNYSTLLPRSSYMCLNMSGMTRSMTLSTAPARPPPVSCLTPPCGGDGGVGGDGGGRSGD